MFNVFDGFLRIFDARRDVQQILARTVDLQYVPGGDNGWGYGGYVDAFNSWSHNYAPGPATINGISGTSTGSDVVGTEAHVGDRLYVTRAYAFQVDRIAYMQIVRVGTGSVVADIWVWNAS